MNYKNYQICSRCIMDTTDPDIQFDTSGVCNHCRRFDGTIRKVWLTGDAARHRLEQIVAKIKASGAGAEYDCIIGLSGGVDSSFLAWKAVQLGLRPLAVHVDAGWNSELAIKNIENIVKTLCIDLHTHVVDWEEMRDLQRAFIRSGVANQDVPQDHAFTAAVWKFASKKHIHTILSGSNYATESILPSSWGHDPMDLRNLLAIHTRHGEGKLRTFPTINFLNYHFIYPYLKNIRVIQLLNFIPYIKAEAIRTLEQELGWRYYGGKHFESRFTKFFQAYYLPAKFGFDKLRAHLSSLVVTGQITREAALREMERAHYPAEQLREDREYFIKKLGLTEAEFENILASPSKSFSDYPSNHVLMTLKARVKRALHFRK